MFVSSFAVRLAIMFATWKCAPRRSRPQLIIDGHVLLMGVRGIAVRNPDSSRRHRTGRSRVGMEASAACVKEKGTTRATPADMRNMRHPRSHDDDGITHRPAHFVSVASATSTDPTEKGGVPNCSKQKLYPIVRNCRPRSHFSHAERVERERTRRATQKA